MPQSKIITLAHWEGQRKKKTGQRDKSASRSTGNVSVLPMASPRAPGQTYTWARVFNGPCIYVWIVYDWSSQVFSIRTKEDLQKVTEWIDANGRAPPFPRHFMHISESSGLKQQAYVKLSVALTPATRQPLSPAQWPTHMRCVEQFNEDIIVKGEIIKVIEWNKISEMNEAAQV